MTSYDTETAPVFVPAMEAVRDATAKIARFLSADAAAMLTALAEPDVDGHYSALTATLAAISSGAPGHSAELRSALDGLRMASSRLATAHAEYQRYLRMGWDVDGDDEDATDFRAEQVRSYREAIDLCANVIALSGYVTA